MNTNTPAARIRSNLKAAGIPAKAVSVRSRHTGSVEVVVKSLAVDFRKVKEIAQQEENIRRCEATGEILSGGNTYVFVTLGDEALDEAMKEVKVPDDFNSFPGSPAFFKNFEVYKDGVDYIVYRTDADWRWTHVARTYSLRNAIAACLGA